MIAPKVKHLILVARNETRLRKYQPKRSRPQLPCEVVVLGRDLAGGSRGRSSILTATSSTADVIIQPEDLQAGAVVCELSLPHDVSRRVALERPDVLVVEGGNMVDAGHAAPRTHASTRGQEFDLNASAAGPRLRA